MAERVIEVDPWNEPAYRLLASVQLEWGGRTAAHEVLEHLQKRLAELGVAPSRPPSTC